jgi:hypothetical protein
MKNKKLAITLTVICLIPIWVPSLSIASENTLSLSDKTYEVYASVGISKEEVDQIGTFCGVVESLIVNNEVTEDKARHIVNQLISGEKKILQGRTDDWNCPIPWRTDWEKFNESEPYELTAQEENASVQDFSVLTGKKKILSGRTDDGNAPIPWRTDWEKFNTENDVVQASSVPPPNPNYIKNSGGSHYIVETFDHNSAANNLGFQVATGFAALPYSMYVRNATMYDLPAGGAPNGNSPTVTKQNDVPYMFFGMYPASVIIGGQSVKAGADMGIYYNSLHNKWMPFWQCYVKIGNNPASHYWVDDPDWQPYYFGVSSNFLIGAATSLATEIGSNGEMWLDMIIFDDDLNIVFNGGYSPPYSNTYATASPSMKMHREIAMARHVDYPSVPAGYMYGATWEGAKVGSSAVSGTTTGMGHWNTTRGTITSNGGAQPGNTPAVQIVLSNQIYYSQETVDIIYPQ